VEHDGTEGLAATRRFPSEARLWEQIMSTVLARDGERVLLRNVDWRLYTLLRDDPERRNVRMTYYQGVLELLSPSGPHERINRILQQLVTEWCQVHGIEYASFGSTTYRSETLSLGLEPDTCFYFQNEALVRDHEEIDLETDPPPDLAIEVDISTSSQRRLLLYTELGVPEVWRTNGEQLEMLALGRSSKYRKIAGSRALPGLSPADLMRFLARRYELGEAALVREFRAWAEESTKPEN
jgi:Uma2 family endonuclease